MAKAVRFEDDGAEWRKHVDGRDPDSPLLLDSAYVERTPTDAEMKAMIRFRNEFCWSGLEKKDPDVSMDDLEDWDWTPLSVGFFIGIGLSVVSALDCARWCRYAGQYWQS